MTTPSRCRCCARGRAGTGRSRSLHFDAHLDTWDTYFGAPYTHGTPFRRASEEGLIDRSGRCTSGSAGRCTATPTSPTTDALGFAIVARADYDDLGSRGVIERIRARVGDRPVYVSVDIDVLDPALRPGHRHPRGRRPASPRAARLLRGFAAIDLVGADIVEVAPAYDHAEITGIAASHVAFELVSAMALTGQRPALPPRSRSRPTSPAKSGPRGR